MNTKIKKAIGFDLNAFVNKENFEALYNKFPKLVGSLRIMSRINAEIIMEMITLSNNNLHVNP